MVLDEGADGPGSIHDITGTDGLTCLGESAQRFWIGLDLLGFAQGKVGLDGIGDFLLTLRWSSVAAARRAASSSAGSRKVIAIPFWYQITPYRLKGCPYVDPFVTRAESARWGRKKRAAQHCKWFPLLAEVDQLGQCTSENHDA